MLLELRRYQIAAGDEPVTQWLPDLADRQARARILARLERLELGNFGDCKLLGDAISKLRVDWGLRVASLLWTRSADRHGPAMDRRQAQARCRYQTGNSARVDSDCANLGSACLWKSEYARASLSSPAATHVGSC